MRRKLRMKKRFVSFIGSLDVKSSLCWSFSIDNDVFLLLNLRIGRGLGIATQALKRRERLVLVVVLEST